MSVDYIRYDVLTQEALRGVVRTVLSDVAAKGLPGEHHFFVTFDTEAEGVRISPRLLAMYPKEMTIVLQHQFWDLTVGPEAFEVGLSFGGIPERLSVPLKAVKAFFDPSVQFGLQFATVESELSSAEAPPPADAQAKKRTRKRPAAVEEGSPGLIPTPANPPPTGAKPGEEPDKPQGGGEIVRLDRFRKK